MSFQVNFGSEQNNVSYEATGSNYLKPWDIYKVKLTEFKYDTVTGKDGTVYEGLRIVFTSDDNKQFNHFVFGVNSEKDMQRPVYNDREMPSQFETLRLTINHILGAFDPKIVEKLNKAIAGKQISIQQYIEFAAKACAGNLNKECYIKIVGDNNNYATMPRIATVWNNGEEAVISNNFISTDASKLSFNNYELRKAEDMKNRKPTSMATEGANSTVTNLDDELNLNPSSDSLSMDDLPF